MDLGTACKPAEITMPREHKYNLWFIFSVVDDFQVLIY